MNKSELRNTIREIIRKIGNKYAVYPEKGGKRLGTHPTRAAAEKQLAAIHINKEAVEIKYTNPNFDVEWEEANRYPEFQEMGKEGWVKVAKKGKPVLFSSIKNILGNVDLNFKGLEEPKKDRFQTAFNKGVIEMPIAVKFGENDYDLVAGNTRLSGLVNNGVDPKIWVVDLTNIEETAGIPRTALPQIHTKDIKDQYMYREGNVLLSQMKPVQTDRVKEDFIKAVEEIKNGTVKPIMLDKRGFIVNGHHRYDAYKALGYKRAPAVVVNASLKELMIKFTNEGSLHNWFNKEDWVRITTAGNIAGPCGTSKNKKNPDRCLPRVKAQSLTKAQRAATARKKKAAGSKGQQVVKNTEKAKVTKEDITNLVVGMIYEMSGKEVLAEKDDRCTRIAKQKYDTWPSAYASGAVVRCRRGEIWKEK